MPGARFQIELVTGHLRELYGAALPRVLYVYHFYGSAEAAYAVDPLLWQMIDGTWSGPTGMANVANFGKVVAGEGGTAAYDIVARGKGWVCFDASKLFSNLPGKWRAMPPPTRTDFGPPR